MDIKYFISAFLLLCLINLEVRGQKAIPGKTNRLVNDFAGMLTQNQENNLERKLRQYNNETSTQIAILTEESLEGDDLFDYSHRVADNWGIGREGKNNGILIFIAEQDRKIFIQTGYGAEGFLPDAMARRIIENIIKPAFRVGEYYNGLDEATAVIMDLGRGEYTAEEWERRTSEGGVPAILILVFIIVLIIIISNINNNGDGGYYRGGKYDMDRRSRRGGGGWIILPGGGGGWSDGGGGWTDRGGGGGFGGLGDFGGFGGGGFGGGGAGGDW